MADNYKDVETEPVQKDTMKGFGSFKITLADILTFATVIRLATLFEYPPRIIEELEKKENRSHVMIRYMEERGQIQPTDITSLLKGLKKLDLLGTESAVRKLFEDHTGIRCTDGDRPTQQREGRIGYFVESLQKMYARWYNKIQPIPYIRERVYCVNDVYVEGGIKVVEAFTSSRQSSQDNLGDEPKSFSDIFDANKISSNRILLEGDPGYGKSTFTLQAAYEWCLGGESSPLKMVQLFILLPLRLLGNISSIYEGIRLLLMPAETNLTDDDIKDILTNSSFGVIVLDGYDEYPHKDSDSDVIKIINGTMFPDFKVVLTSRSSSLPRDLDPSTVTLRLTGFDDTSMYEYIKRAVTGGNDKEAKKIKDILNSSPVLADICQIPIFCVMFAHITKEQSHNVARLSSVTSFFRYIMSCFYSHTRKKSSGTEASDTISDYHALNKLAFDSLVSKSQQISWSKKCFIETVGNECCKELLNIGVLVEETILTINDEPGVDFRNLVKYQEFVRFYHKLFAEWYAGNYLASYVGGFWPFWLNYKLGKINPVDLQYVFRFASGLNQKACKRIVRYLERLDGGNTFASLCLFEQSMDQRILEEMVRGLHSHGMIIRSTDSRLLQRSNIQLLEVASRNDVRIRGIALDKTLMSADQSAIYLVSGLRMPVVSSIEELEIITNSGHEFNEEDLIGLLTYGKQCQMLKKLLFIDGLLPLSVETKHLSLMMQSEPFNVIWRLCNYEYRLAFSSGKWHLVSQDSSVPSHEDFQKLTELFGKKVILRKDDNKHVQCNMVLLLENARNNEIPISGLTLDGSLTDVDDAGLSLSSGIRVPVLNSLQRLEIKTERGNEITSQLFFKVVSYGQGSDTLTQVSFTHCLLPLFFPVEFLSSFTKPFTFRVVWKPVHDEFTLDFPIGNWKLISGESVVLNQIEDQQSLLKMCSDPIILQKDMQDEHQDTMKILLEIATSHNIAISCLVVDKSLISKHQNTIILKSGDNLPNLLTLEKLEVKSEKGEEVTEEEVFGVVTFGQNHRNLRKITFSDCLLPLFFDVQALSSTILSNNLDVFWRPSKNTFRLDQSSGFWELQTTQESLRLAVSTLF